MQANAVFVPVTSPLEAGPEPSLPLSTAAASSMTSAARSEPGHDAGLAHGQVHTGGRESAVYDHQAFPPAVFAEAVTGQVPATPVVAERRSGVSPQTSHLDDDWDEPPSLGVGDIAAGVFFSYLEASRVFSLPQSDTPDHELAQFPAAAGSGSAASSGNMQKLLHTIHDASGASPGSTTLSDPVMLRKRSRVADAPPRALDDSLARLRLLQRQDADKQQQPRDGPLTPVFNAGHFFATAHRHGIDPRTVAKRIMTVLATGRLDLLRRLAQSFGGRLPVNLLQAAAPHLRTHLHALLMARFRPADVPLRMCSDFVFDGVHLTIMGFIAAIVADSRDDSHATVPRGTVLVAPRFKVHTSQDGGANLTTEIDRGAVGEDTGAAHAHSIFSEADGLRGPSCSLSTLYTRWPHLCSIVQHATAAEQSEAKAVLLAEAADRDVDIPDALASLYFKFLNGTGTACVFWISRAKGMYTSFVGETEAFLRLTGTTHAGVIKYTSLDPDADENNAMQVLHPSNIGRRTLAALTAQNNNLLSYTFEGLHLRYATSRVPSFQTQSCSEQAASPPGGEEAMQHTARRAAAAPNPHRGRESSARAPHMTGHISQAASMGDSYTQQALYTPFYAMQTMHLDHFPSGKKRMDVVFFHDTVFTRQTVPAVQLSSAAGELAALENLLLSPALATEVRTAMRRGSNARAEKVGALEALLTTAVMDMKSRLLKRLTMALSFESDPLLNAKLASQARQPVQADDVLSGEFAPALNGLSLARLKRLRDGIQQGISPQALHRVRGLLALMVRQEEQAMLLHTGDTAEPIELPFPLPSMRKAAARWMTQIKV